VPTNLVVYLNSITVGDVMMHTSIDTEVINIFKTHTLYSEDRLNMGSHLEGELGIDSVVLTSIIGDINKTFKLPIGLLHESSVTTIKDIIDCILASGIVATSSVTVSTADHTENGSTNASTILAIFREHTQYSEEVLALDRHLEGDLGIDSVVLTSVLADISKSLDLPEHLIQSRSYNTIREIIDHAAQAQAKINSKGTHQPVIQGQGDRNIDVSNKSFSTLSTQKEIPLTKTSDANEETETIKLSLNDLLKHFLGTNLQEVDRKKTFLAQGFSVTVYDRLLNAIEKSLEVKQSLQLKDCDTLEKLEQYLLAAQPHTTVKLHSYTSNNPSSHSNGNGHKQSTANNNAGNEDDFDNRSMKDFIEERSPDLFTKVKSFNQFYKKRQSQNLYWYGMPLESRCQNRAIIYDEVSGRHREFLMFASNNYLGLANHPKVIDAICEATRNYGATNTGCRLIGGTNHLHKELERRIAKFKGTESAIVYPSGYSANLGAISALVKKHDAVIIDKFNHMSILDGCALSGAARKIYQHDDMDDLERVLSNCEDKVDGKLIVTDGVFSMHGNICNLPEIVRLAHKYGAKVLVDDAHSTGVLGAKGSGTSEHFNMKGMVDLELGTMSKTLAGVGGFVAASEEVVEYLRFYSNSYVFAATIPAGVAAGLIASIDVMESEPERLIKLWQNIRYLKDHLLSAGLNLGKTESAIIPIVIGDDKVTLRLGRAVRERGLFCQTVVYPGVSVGDARLRISVTYEHTREDLDMAVDIILSSAKEIGILSL
jgi:4-hydroxy-2,2'-bipyrrole-5-methanol synthase